MENLLQTVGEATNYILPNLRYFEDNAKYQKRHGNLCFLMFKISQQSWVP